MPPGPRGWQPTAGGVRGPEGAALLRGPPQLPGPQPGGRTALRGAYRRRLSRQGRCGPPAGGEGRAPRAEAGAGPRRPSPGAACPAGSGARSPGGAVRRGRGLQLPALRGAALRRRRRPRKRKRLPREPTSPSGRSMNGSVAGGGGGGFSEEVISLTRRPSGKAGGRPSLTGPSAPPGPGQPRRGLGRPEAGARGWWRGLAGEWGELSGHRGGGGRVPAVRTVPVPGLWPLRPLLPRRARGSGPWRIRCCGESPRPA